MYVVASETIRLRAMGMLMYPGPPAYDVEGTGGGVEGCHSPATSFSVAMSQGEEGGTEAAMKDVRWTAVAVLLALLKGVGL